MLPPNHPYVHYVKRVASRIIKAAGMESKSKTWQAWHDKDDSPPTRIGDGMGGGVDPVAKGV